MSSMTTINPSVHSPAAVSARVALAPQGALVQGSNSVLGTIGNAVARTGMPRFRTAGTAAPPRGPAR